jgi:hypothetical protein
MAEKKSILEEALLDIKNIESALNANTREILRSVAREEIDSVVKESLSEVYEEEEVSSMNEESHEEHEKSETPSEEKKEHGKGGSEKKEKKEHGKGSSKKMTEGEMETEGMETEGMTYEEGMEVEGMTYEEGMDDLGTSEELDMTSASDDDVIAIYKKLTGEDEIEIVGDDIHLNVSEPGQYVIKNAKTGSAPAGIPSMEPEMGDELGPEMDLDGEEEIEGSVDYEIEMGDDEEGEAPSDLEPLDDEKYEAGEEEEEEEEEQLDEAIPVGSGQAHRMPYKANLGQPLGAGADNLKSINESARVLTETKKKYNNLLTEAKKLKGENEEFRKALKEFRKKLVETVVVNSNLSYMTRLITEHTTSKAEKLNIIKRFDDEVTNLSESKKLYRAIVNELEGRKPISESIDKKLIKEVSTGSSRKLTESTAYVDPSTKRILDLIKRVEQK